MKDDDGILWTCLMAFIMAAACVFIGYLMINSTFAQSKPPIKTNTLPLTSPNVIQIQADTIILSTGQSVVKFNPERDVTCYVVNGTSISCVKFGR